MHKLLERQLKRLYGSLAGVPEELGELLAVVDESYEQADADRLLLERSLDLTSDELLEANAELREERADLERRVADRTESIRRSEARYRDLFERSRDVIYIASPEGRLLDINPAGVELFGFDSREEMIDAVDLNRAYSGRQDLLRRLEKTSFLRDEELQLRRRDGKRLTVLATIAARRNEWGRIGSMLGIVRDVTRQRVLERQLREAQKMEAIGRLAGGVAHDFNNLLTAIIGYSDLIRESLPPNHAVLQQLEEIRKAGKRGAEMTRQLLAFSRRQVLKPTTLQLNNVVANLEKLLRRLIGEDVKLTTDLEDELRAVRADPGQIEQVVMNLVINSREAMPEGGHVEVRTRNVVIEPGQTDGPPGVEPGAYALLEVTDTGVGMDEHTREQIFEPFFTTKEDGGTGLGLSTVYGIVRQSGGRIAVNSRPGEGTTFRVLLPGHDEKPMPESPRRASGQLPPGRETVLLVEDEPVVLTFVDEFLTRQGYTVLKASDAEEALDVAKAHNGRIDLLLSDVVMPGVNGVDLCRRMMRSDPDLKVLLMSGYTGKRLASDAAAAELSRSHFLQKPFTAEQLGWKIREVLESRERPLAFSPDSA
jgi:PAS domain S-box-containing protein